MGSYIYWGREWGCRGFSAFRYAVAEDGNDSKCTMRIMDTDTRLFSDIELFFMQIVDIIENSWHK